MGTMGSPRTLRWWSSQALLKPWGPEIRDAGCLGFVSKPGVGAPSVDLRKARWRRRETAGGGGGRLGRGAHVHLERPAHIFEDVPDRPLSV